MALIKCPECGKENISDSAEMCPACGYGIKAHFEREMQRELYKRKLESITMPNMPEKENSWFIVAGIGVIELCMSSISIIMFFGGIITIAVAFYAREDNYKRAMEKYNLAVTDIEKYRRKILQEQKEAEERLINSIVKCPHCGSIDTKKISTTSRVASVAMVGVASSKIGKQYECKNCGYKW